MEKQAQNKQSDKTQPEVDIADKRLARLGIAGWISWARASAYPINGGEKGPRAATIVFSVYFSLSARLPRGRGNDGTPSRCAVCCVPAPSCPPQLCPRIPPARDAAPCSHRSPSAAINKLPLITAVIAELFHSSNYSSQPDPGYLGRALSPKMAPSQPRALIVPCGPRMAAPGRGHCCAHGAPAAAWDPLCVRDRASHHGQPPCDEGEQGTGSRNRREERSGRDKAL